MSIVFNRGMFLEAEVVARVATAQRVSIIRIDLTAFEIYENPSDPRAHLDAFWHLDEYCDVRLQEMKDEVRKMA